MKNLFTILLLVVSFLAVGQTNNTTEEIKYWKSIAESDDTVAYRQYLNRYGDDGLYKDEAITRIALLKASGKQAQTKSIECCFYTEYKTCSDCAEYVVKFDSNLDKVWFKRTNYDTIRSNLAVSKKFYEDQATLIISRDSYEYRNVVQRQQSFNRPIGYRTQEEYERKLAEQARQVSSQTMSPNYIKYKNAWTADEKYEYAPMKSTSARDVYFKRGTRIYKYKESGWDREKTIQGYRYVAFSKDKSSIIMWFEDDENLDGQIFEKRTYYRVPKEDLLPKAVNYDFLNE